MHASLCHYLYNTGGMCAGNGAIYGNTVYA